MIPKHLFFTLSSLFLFLITSPASSNNHANILGAKECAECHEESMDVWKKTKHQKNFKKLSKNKDAKAIAQKMGIKRIKKGNTLCASCHYTVKNKPKAKVIAGVSCESCHGAAKNWIETHNDFGGKGIKQKNESPAHRKKREASLEKHGMIRPDNIYAWAKNCMSCHMVANEKLVNVGGHETGSDFKLSKRTQGKIRHYPKASVDELRFNNIVGDAVELEIGLRALASAKTSGKYSSSMVTRTTEALNKLKSSSSRDSSGYAAKSVALAKSATIKAGNKRLDNIADNIAINTMKMVQKKNGYPYPASKLKSTYVAAPAKKAPRPKVSRPVTVHPKVEKIVQPKVVSKPKAIPKKEPVIIQPGLPKKEPVIVQPTLPKKQPAYRTAPKAPAPAPAPAPEYKPAAKRISLPPVKTPAPAVTPLQSQRASSTGSLVSHYKVITPTRNALCNTFTPWALGTKAVKNNTSLPNDSCIGIELQTSDDSDIYIFIESVSGATQLLMPNQCNIANMANNTIRANTTIVLPTSKNQSASALQLKTLSNLYRLHTVIVKSQSDARQEIAQLAISTESICAEQVNKSSDLRTQIERIVSKYSNQVEWKTTTIDPN